MSTVNEHVCNHPFEIFSAMISKTIERTRAMLPIRRSGEIRGSASEKYLRFLSVAFLSLGFALLSVVPSVQAQDSDAEWITDFGLVVGGASFLQSDELGGVDVAGGLNPGLAITGSVGIKPTTSPLSYQVEVQYARFGLDDEGRFGAGGAPVTADGNANVLSGTGNVLLGASLTSRLHSYLIAGAGVYRLFSNVRYTASNGRSIRSPAPAEGKTRFGLNAGAGLEVAVGPVHSFVEARFHSVLSGTEDANFVPVSVGVRF